MGGPRRQRCLSFKSTRTIAGIVDLSMDACSKSHVFGFGYSFVEIQECSIGMELRLSVLATPVFGAYIEVVLVGQVREMRRPKRPILGLRFV